MDKDKEFLFILVANLGKYFFINPLAMRGKTSIISCLIIHSINSCLGFLKVDMRSWNSSWIRFRNNNNPRIAKIYGEKSSPIEGNMIPNIVEKRIEIESARRTLVS